MLSKQCLRVLQEVESFRSPPPGQYPHGVHIRGKGIGTGGLLVCENEMGGFLIQKKSNKISIIKLLYKKSLPGMGIKSRNTVVFVFLRKNAKIPVNWPYLGAIMSVGGA